MAKITSSEKVLEVLRAAPHASWSAKKLAKVARVSISSVYRVLSDLEDKNIVLHDLDMNMRGMTVQIYSYLGEQS
jgi:DNA-binding IclR family transcriptional regulator